MNLVDCTAEVLVHGGRGAADSVSEFWPGEFLVNAPDFTTLAMASRVQTKSLTTGHRKPSGFSDMESMVIRFAPLLAQETRIARKKRRKYEQFSYPRIGNGALAILTIYFLAVIHSRDSIFGTKISPCKFSHLLVARGSPYDHLHSIAKSRFFNLFDDRFHFRICKV